MGEQNIPYKTLRAPDPIRTLQLSIIFVDDVCRWREGLGINRGRVGTTITHVIVLVGFLQPSFGGPKMLILNPCRALCWVRILIFWNQLTLFITSFLTGTMRRASSLPSPMMHKLCYKLLIWFLSFLSVSML